jgi:hypothetical protein
METGAPACGGDAAPQPLDDAARLAAGLRVLALALGVLLAEARRIAVEAGQQTGMSRAEPAGSFRPWREALPAPDTS